MSMMERIYQIDQLLAKKRFATRQELEERLGISWATLKRDIAYMRDRLHAPIVFDGNWAGIDLIMRKSELGLSTNCLDFGFRLRKSMRSLQCSIFSPTWIQGDC